MPCLAATRNLLGDKTTGSATFDARVQEFLKGYQALAEVPNVRVRRFLTADLAIHEAEPPKTDPDEAEARALLDSFDGRTTEIEQRIDRVLARLDAG